MLNKRNKRRIYKRVRNNYPDFRNDESINEVDSGKKWKIKLAYNDLNFNFRIKKK